MPTRGEVVCETCGALFVARRSTARYCSPRCQKAGRRREIADSRTTQADMRTQAAAPAEPMPRGNVAEEIPLPTEPPRKNRNGEVLVMAERDESGEPEEYMYVPPETRAHWDARCWWKPPNRL